ncbi:insulinase family protein [Candidatus Saccharibacteria bacterium]|nr:insulinase family protein [Candidatus Saccharibacteria bacterium]MBI3338419.1 insulinase family protein [Candidatus Saccharibacteria bacterium]
MKHKVNEISLANGARGLLIDVPDATVMTFELNFRAGEYLVEREKWETPHLMEHVLLGANELIPKASAFYAEFEKNGAYSNASTGTYDINYESECADFEWDRILSLLLVAIAKPKFLKEEFTAEFSNVREELTARSNNHFRHLSLSLREAYGFKVMTDQERIKLMTNVYLEDIRTHYKNTHTTSNLRFVIAGKLPLQRRKHIAQALSAMELPKGDGRLELPEETPSKITHPLYIHNATVDNLYFYIDTFMNRRMRDPEIDALGLINSMLTETLYSRILGTARERGLVYSMNSGLGQTKNVSNWWFGTQVLPANAPALFDIINKELKSVFAGKLNEEDITAAKQYALGRYQRSGQTVGGMASGYTYRYFFDEHIDDYYKVPERIRAISRNRIIEISKELFSENIWGLGCLGNAGEDVVNQLYDRIKPLWK